MECNLEAFGTVAVMKSYTKNLELIENENPY